MWAVLQGVQSTHICDLGEAHYSFIMKIGGGGECVCVSVCGMLVCLRAFYML